MPRSANGWPVLQSRPALVRVPDTPAKFCVRSGDVAYVFAYLARRFHREVEPLDLPGERDEWGWAYRAVRGQTSGFSNHASGTAIDLNATRHPRGQHGTFTKAERRAVRAILADLEDTVTGRCVVRWGEDFSTVVDGMHFEICADENAVRRVANRLRAEAQKTKPDQKEDGVQLNEKVDLGRGQSAVLGQPDGEITVEEGIAIAVTTLREILVEIRRVAGR